MSRLWPRVQDLAGRMVFFTIVLTIMGIDRMTQGGHSVALMATEAEMDPQQSLVHLITLMIAGSLSMMALGYRARG